MELALMDKTREARRSTTTMAASNGVTKRRQSEIRNHLCEFIFLPDPNNGINNQTIDLMPLQHLISTQSFLSTNTEMLFAFRNIFSPSRKRIRTIRLLIPAIFTSFPHYLPLSNHQECIIPRRKF
ncbi:hypothetical protein ISN44_As01g014690 [Arabidopsis suecica]|uniref:Uncharacterized protein n=1 Tax=Arabidopsis suecica TaxID=45249 RepID=A0A8T2H5F7_ARASU|nr:hypothetical protein ISN44_As01g014690 [Arabidopsis suecica]